MFRPHTRPWIFRGAAVLAFLIAQVLVLTVPLKMQEPDDWGFRYAVRHFAHGQLTIGDGQFIVDSQGIWEEGGQLLSYGKLPENRWAFTRAPGYVFYLIPFEAAGVPALGAALLSLGLAVVLYLLLARLRDERTAFFGVILLLFTPLYLAMWQRVYIDTLAATAFCGMGGGLYLIYWMGSGKLKPRAAAVVLFLAGLFLAASVAVRYSNITIAAAFMIHYAVMMTLSAIRRERFSVPAVAFIPGLALPLAGLLAYQGAVFGSPFTWGGRYSQLDISFAWDYLGTGIAYSILRQNVIELWAPLLLALPILFTGVPALAAAGLDKKVPGGRLKAWPEIPMHAWWLLAGWVMAVFGVYLFYEWTSTMQNALVPFPLITRFYLPALFPLVLVSAMALARLPARVWVSVLAVFVVVGAVFFIQTARMQVQFTAGVLPPSLSAPVEERTGI